MDEIVRQAMAKWPNVPHCYGWLSLDRRGQWRMRDEAAQASGALGDPIRHAALIAFIARNYLSDDEGRWYFQNGPQRVYVSLAYAPFIVRLHWDDATGASLTDQLGNVFAAQACLLDENGNVAFVGPTPDRGGNAPIALLHDHDLDLLTAVTDLEQAAELAQTADDTADAKGAVRLHWRNGESLAFATVHSDSLPSAYGFVRTPAAPGAD
ncbi:hypothetical protein PTE30175_02159 [Pandoraea terrae]|uniref:DUF2946 domain-containing protein n=1 Tax=Pandoraea terrae TaxID=1537710 RepID=A0A5E4UWK5_9BURK|nr:DUF2946 family protein [Pandoraea terrae]VVE02910.1 hypothetical protein PTE30175_02159 [Pandoraea terrae]